MTILTVLLMFLLATTVFKTSWSVPQTPSEVDRVITLPGQPQVGFNLYSGNVTVDAIEGRDLFYVFAECSNDTYGTKPLVIWFNGGPGCSSIASGFSQENGPFKILPNGTGLYLNDYAWNKEVNMIWLESPTGVGFSYARLNMSANTAGGDTRTAEDAYNFLVGWMNRFPKYKGRDFYLTGESYAGHYVPQLAKLILERNVVSPLKINLKGYMVGNPDIDHYLDTVGTVDYYYSHAMISTETYNGIKSSCDFANKTCCSELCGKYFGNASEEIGNIDFYSINTDVCTGPTFTRKQQGLVFSKNNMMLENLRAGYDPCSEDNVEIYFNRPDVQQALHANVSGIIPYAWTECSDVLSLNWTDSALTMIPTYHELIAAGLKIWVYSGDADSVVSVTSTRDSVEAMTLTITTPWHPWYDREQVGGRVVLYDGLTFVTIRGAGHQVPLLEPSRFLQLFTAFIHGEALPIAPFG